MSEVYRFSLLVNFDKALFPEVYSRLYDVMRINRNLEPKYHPRMRKNSVQESNLHRLVMAYSPEDINARGKAVDDFDLTEKSTSLNQLPLALRKHPPNWSIRKYEIGDPPTFSVLVHNQLDSEIIDNRIKVQDGLRRLAADRARVKRFQN